MSFLFIFLDGVGLGSNDPEVNPWVSAALPTIRGLLDGRPMVAGVAPVQNEKATLLALDACLEVDGLPQSATGQATLLSGLNISAQIGKHYGPKPNPPIAEILRRGNIFATLKQAGLKVSFLNAYPPGYFAAIESGRRLHSAVPLAVASSGTPLLTVEDLSKGRGLSADFTGQGWRDRLDFPETPVLSLHDAGVRMGELAAAVDFAFFEFWLSDIAGHQQDMDLAQQLLQNFDQVLSGLLGTWEDNHGLILVTSDHGNIEDLGTRRHTDNLVPALILGDPLKREDFGSSLKSLVDVTPGITRYFGLT